MLDLDLIDQFIKDNPVISEEGKKQNPQHFIFKPNKKRGTNRKNLDKEVKKAINKKSKTSYAKNVNKIQNQR